MDCAIALDRPIRSSAFTVSKNSKLSKPDLSRRQLSLGSVNSRIPNRSLNASSSSYLLKIRLRRHGSTDSHSHRVSVSSNDAQFGSFPEESEAQAPTLTEFITSERVKVIAMLALALALCNADRVVMSVAIVPLSLSHGWSRSFAGIVQVVLLYITVVAFVFIFFVVEF